LCIDSDLHIVSGIAVIEQHFFLHRCNARILWSQPKDVPSSLNDELGGYGVVQANVGQNVTPQNPSLGLILHHFVHTMVL
jgi:hypothetical protein